MTTLEVKLDLPDRLAREAQAAGLRVWRSTRCASGRVLSVAASTDPIPAVALPPAQARLALLLELCA